NNIKNKAELSFSGGKFSEALNLFKEIERVVGLHPELANDLAVVNFRLGNIQEAMDYFCRALVLQEANQQRISNNLMAVIEELVNLGGGDWYLQQILVIYALSVVSQMSSSILFLT